MTTLASRWEEFDDREKERMHTVWQYEHETISIAVLPFVSIEDMLDAFTAYRNLLMPGSLAKSYNVLHKKLEAMYDELGLENDDKEEGND